MLNLRLLLCDWLLNSLLSIFNYIFRCWAAHRVIGQISAALDEPSNKIPPENKKTIIFFNFFFFLIRKILTIIKNYILLGKNCNFQLYWSVSFGRNEFLAWFSTCSALFLTCSQSSWPNYFTRSQAHSWKIWPWRLRTC